MTSVDQRAMFTRAGSLNLHFRRGVDSCVHAFVTCCNRPLGIAGTPAPRLVLPRGAQRVGFGPLYFTCSREM